MAAMAKKKSAAPAAPVSDPYRFEIGQQVLLPGDKSEGVVTWRTRAGNGAARRYIVSRGLAEAWFEEAELQEMPAARTTGKG